MVSTVPVIDAPAPSSGSIALAPGVLLGHTYRIEALLARGGMGEVYRARHEELGSLHAIKVILDDLGQDAKIINMFQEEAKKLRRVRDDAVVGYEGLFRDEFGRRYLVMELVDGPSLSDIMKERKLTVAEVGVLRDRMARGLAAAHEKGIYHRDISPDNVIFPGGRVENAKIIDFGIAKSADPSDKTVIGDEFAGKYSYVSPEQLGMYDSKVDGRSDMYSLALVLIAALNGRKMDMGSSIVKAIDARRGVPDLSGVPATLRPELERMLQPQAKDRFPDIRDLISGNEVTQTQAGPNRAGAVPNAGKAKRGGLIGVAALAVAVVVVGGGLYAVMGTGGSKPVVEADRTQSSGSSPGGLGGTGTTSAGPTTTGQGNTGSGTTGPTTTATNGAGPAATGTTNAGTVTTGPAATGTAGSPTTGTTATNTTSSSPTTGPATAAATNAGPTASGSTTSGPATAATTTSGPATTGGRTAGSTTGPSTAASTAAGPTTSGAATTNPTTTAATSNGGTTTGPAPTTAGQAATGPAINSSTTNSSTATASASSSNPPVQEARIIPPTTATLEPPKPNPAVVRASLQQILGGYSCARLTGQVGADLSGTVSGFVENTADVSRLRSQLAALTDARLSTDVAVHGWPHCGVLSVLASDTHDQGATLPTIQLDRPNSVYKAGQTLTVKATMARAGLLYVDYIDGAGEVVHLLPNPVERQNRLAAGQQISLGKPKGSTGPDDRVYEIGPPYGPNMIVAIVSSEPLFPQERPEVEDAKTYLPALTERLQSLAAKGAEASSVSRFFDSAQ